MKDIRPVGARSRRNAERYAVALAIVAVALVCAFSVEVAAGVEFVDLAFLMAVIGIAIRFGLGPSLVASVLSVLAYNFFFLEPLHTFRIAEPTNVAALVFFSIVALVTSHLAARARAEAMSARRRAEMTEALHAFSDRITGIVEMDELLDATLQQVSSVLWFDGVVLLRDPAGELQVTAKLRNGDCLAELDLAVVQTAWPPEGAAGRTARETLRAGGRLFVPLRTSSGVVGALGVSCDRSRGWPTAEELRIVGALANQAAVAVERVHLAAERDEARLTMEKERLRSTMLASLSHDLKTPLASITGAITSLRLYGDLYDAAARDDLAGMIQDEAERLTRYVGNLLDMTRLEAGGVAVRLQPTDLGEPVGTALRRCEGILRGHSVSVTIDPDLPMLNLDPVLFEQVLVNLIDNAAKYAGASSTVSIDGRTEGDSVVLTVSDEGPGIAPGDSEQVFDKFYRAEAGDRDRAGTGMGLAICRGFVGALGGTITAANRDGPAAGAQFTIAFPVSTFAADLHVKEDLE